MKRNWTIPLGALITTAVLAAGTAIAYEGSIIITPASNVVSGSSCIDGQSNGGLIFDAGCVGDTRYAERIGVPFGPNPGSTNTFYWRGSQPAGSSLCAQLISYTKDGDVYQTGSEVCGGGNQSQSIGRTVGTIIMRVYMQSDSTAALPTLNYITTKIYAN
ncbi:MAG: hypothetical protein JW940_25750 [Polyangiaceae bacterium]|nr:hypothetical protein [Polyangiaceae bacterium]